MAPSKFDSALNGLRARLADVELIIEKYSAEAIGDYEGDEIGMALSDTEASWSACQDLYYEVMSSVTDAQRQHEFFTTNQFQVVKMRVNESRLLWRRRLDADANANVERQASRDDSMRGRAERETQGEFRDYSSVGRLGRIDPPTFNGDRTQWPSFRDSFESMVVNTQLSKVAKFHYLKRSLVGKVAGLFKNMPITDGNFDRAWAELNALYNNERLLKKAFVEALLQIAPVSKPGESTEYERVLSGLQENLMSLEGFGCEVDRWGELLLGVAYQKFDPVFLDDWEKEAISKPREPSWEDFKKYVWRRIEVCTSRGTITSTIATPQVSTRTGNNQGKRTSRSHSTNKVECPLCKNQHSLTQCDKFKSQSLSERYATAKQLRVCFNCLYVGHSVINCPSKHVCSKSGCGKRHHTLLHSTRSEQTKRKADDIGEESSSSAKRAHTVATHAIGNCSVLLATAKIRIAAVNGHEYYFRALIDQGSESSFISEKAAKLLNLPRRAVNVTVTGIGANVASKIRTAITIKFRGQRSEMPPHFVEALVMRTLTTTQTSRVNYNILELPHLTGLRLADDDPLGTQPIDLILGAEVFSSILQEGVKLGGANEPVAQETSLGWILSGRVVPVAQRDVSNKFTSAFHSTCIENLDKSIKAFWEIEELPRLNVLSPEDKRCEEIFKSTTTRQADGRYCVNIPFKSEVPEVGNSYRMASQCYDKLEARLMNNADLSSQYHDFLSEYLALGHMTPDSSFHDNPKLRCFLPHHPVIRECSTTTKCRVVFNASARSSNGKSLNDCMLVGPKLLNELTDVVLRWRMHRYVCCADIEKMFRQIQVSNEHTPYQCILWRPPDKERVAVYRLNTVTYGTTSAPYLSMRVLKQLAEDESSRFPLAASILKRDIYMDDTLFGADTLDQCKLIRNELMQLLNAGGFFLRKWESNDDQLIIDLPENLRARKDEIIFQESESVKVLGIHWKRDGDCFSFKVNMPNHSQVTKRAVLSCIASLFDPLGWVSPIIIRAKIFMQKLWQEKVDWDTELSEELRIEWIDLQLDFNKLVDISIPRWVETLSNSQWEVHGFADASSKAYGGVVYLKTWNRNKPVISLLMSKTRVAPLKELTIPRLELSAALLLAELLAYVKRVLCIEGPSIHCWSDSTIVLAWLASCPSKWKRFVSNRVCQIHENIPGIQWRHVISECNPADLASRGVSSGDLASNTLWWHGPQWLSFDSSDWPINSPKTPDPSDLEIKTKSMMVQLKQGLEGSEIFTRYSSWDKLLRVTARIKSWKIIASKIENPPSFCKLIQNATYHWIITMQRFLFSDEIRSLQNNRQVTRGKLHSLNPFIDKDGVLRVGGRLQNADLPHHLKHPIILGSHYLIKLIIKDAHEKTKHGGAQLMLRYLRETYWILRARDLVRNCIRNCVTCVRHRARTLTQQMGELPTERVTPARAFQKVGLDMAGPYWLRAMWGRGRSRQKGYIVIFVCLATRAVHLQFVSDYSSKSFLAAFKRFVSLYGLPSYVLSDNGPNLHGAEREMREHYEELMNNMDLAAWIATNKVDWRFNPPSAPHFGGIWEAGVKSTKHHLKRVINNQVLNFEEMTTLLFEISACLNSRPIAPMSDSIDDFSYLTPGHFLSEGLMLAVPAPDLSELSENRLRRWERVQQMRDQFWRTWRQDYLLQLQQRKKWKNQSESVKVGDIVLLSNESIPPSKWELGRVIKLFPDKNGSVRVVNVKTAKSMYKRPIHKLCLLPLRSAQATEELIETRNYHVCVTKREEIRTIYLPTVGGSHLL